MNMSTLLLKSPKPKHLSDAWKVDHIGVLFWFYFARKIDGDPWFT